MAITRMVSKEQFLADPENIRVVHDYSGHESGLHHCKECVHFKPRTDGFHSNQYLEKDKHSLAQECLDGCDKCYVREPLYLETTHIGQVIDLGEVNGYSDSDFYAEVWNGQTIERIQYGTTRGWTYPNNAWIDASPETFQAAKNFREKNIQKERERINALKELEANNIAKKRAAMQEQKNKVLAMKNTVVRFTHKKKEEAGNLFWVGDSNSGETLRIGVRKASGEVIWANATSIV